MSPPGIGMTGESAKLFSMDRIFEYLQYADKKGFDSAWIAEDFYFRDAVAQLSALAVSTKKLKLATGVINPYARDPALIAMSFALLDEISHGRAILGIGPSMRLWIYETHLRSVPQLAAMKESIHIFRELIAGRKVTYEGKVFGIRNVRLGIKPVRERIPVYVGAMGPKMLELTGEIGDGALLTAGVTPEYVKYAVEKITTGAKKAGRKPGDVKVAAYLVVSAAKDVEKAKQIVKGEVAFLVLLPHFEPILRESGLNLDYAKPIIEKGREGDLKGAAELVPDEYVEALTIFGTVKECKEKLQDYVSAGLSLPVIVPMGTDKDVREIIATINT